MIDLLKMRKEFRLVSVGLVLSVKVAQCYRNQRRLGEMLTGES